MFIYFWRRETEKQSMSRAGAERQGNTESEAGFRLWAVSIEPDAQLELTNCKIMTWAEVGHPTDWATQAPPDKLDFKLKAVTRDEEGHYIIITGSIHQGELTIINVYALNSEAPKYIKQLITNVSNLIGKNVVIAGDFNTPHNNGQII